MLTEPPIGARMISVGRNFRFGHGGEGTTTMLRDYGEGHQVTVEVPSLVCSGDGKPISSTRIRRLIAQGDVDEAAALLGRVHCVAGTVVPGDGRGAALGIPTANLDVDERSAVPGRGVYAGQVRVDDRWWCAAINVGRAPTFRDAGDIRVEAFLLDYDGPEIYGESLCVGFLRRLRNEMRFAGPEALVRQIERDIAATRAAAEGCETPVC
jgi:riboflavin kinase/FMN adenylyltransferase